MLHRTALLFSLTAVSYAAMPPGYALPDVPITRIIGKKIDLKQYRGKALVVALISTECQDCALTIDLLNKLHTENASKGLEVVAAAGDENAGANLFAYEKLHRPQYPLGYLSKDAFLKLASLPPAERPFVPILLFVDPKGMVRVKLMGDDPLMKNRDLAIRSSVRELMKEPGIKP